MQFMNILKLIMSKNLKDIEILSETSLWSILGKNYKKYFEDIICVPANDPSNKEKIPKFITRSHKCLMCAAIQDLDLENYKNLNYSEVISGALGALMELILESMGYNYSVSVKETKCMLRGDPYSEVTMFFNERSK